MSEEIWSYISYVHAGPSVGGIPLSWSRGCSLSVSTASCHSSTLLSTSWT